jgi:hypothetical protein
MKCKECELLLAQGESNAAVEDHLSACSACRSIAEELRVNASVLEELRREEMPGMEVKLPRARKVYPWAIGVAAAAALMVGLLLPRPAAAPVRPAPTVVSIVPQEPQAETPPAQAAEAPAAPVRSRPQKLQPLKIKMLTPDPDVVIYWIVD